MRNPQSLKNNTHLTKSLINGLEESNSRLNRSGKSRIRHWAPKVKTGCMTCRIRRVKCDETKPVSLPAMLFYRKKVRWLQFSPPRAAHYGPQRGTDAFLLGVTTPNLAGFFDQGRWARRLLQMSHRYPALWHAMTAVACIHRDFIANSTPITMSRMQDSPQVRLALQQWNKSIQSLQKLLSGQVLTKFDRLVILSVCILFITMSSLQGRLWQALVHINGGLKLIHQWNLADRGEDQRDEDSDLDVLLVLFTQLDSQARPYLPSLSNNLQWTDKQIILSSSTTPFKSLLEACVALEVHFNRMMQIFTNNSIYIDVPDAGMQIKKQQCLLGLTEWDTRLDKYLGIIPQLEDERPLKVLYVRRRLAQVALSMDLTKGELAHDDFVEDYAYMLELMGDILGDPMDPFRQPACKYRPTITTEPLFLIAFRCREPTIRRHAIRLLRQYPRREGICEGMAALKIAERVMEIEAECLSSPGNACAHGKWICENHRVTWLQFFLVHDRQARTVVHTREDLLHGRPGREIVTTYW
ncbi:Zn(II)2Cys6 transcription factor [Aspergillus vadensis CBS 113365]|uniref:Dynamin GTPase n=1 Tax=Aspergillus vadensis (strain CBS 113365 / IMI 142717 / IBT 24658) TaxID=1448311 RepID=A0A319BKA1_ASPVC|nr:dynamin GTPase [Aspergillus vadensis CBS 113365]PYH66123.1 dynamin GTPase [Aspergillus vadensis CBS 113365]